MKRVFQHLGIIFGVMVLLCATGRIDPAHAAAGKTASAMGTFVLTVSGSGSLSFGGSSDLFMANLAPGYAYRLEPGPYASAQRLTPVVTGAEKTTPIEMNITHDGAQAENIVLSFDLPDRLRNDKGTSTPCFFPDDALYCPETGEHLNPNQTIQFLLEPNQIRTLKLGIVVAIPQAGGAEDTYTGMVRTLLNITGL